MTEQNRALDTFAAQTLLDTKTPTPILGDMKTLTTAEPFDAEALANRAFRDEGAFLLSAERVAEQFTRRTSGDWKLIGLSHDELREIAGTFAKVVAVAKEYHLGAAGCGQ